MAKNTKEKKPKENITVKEKDLPIDVTITPMNKLVRPHVIRIELKGRYLTFGPVFGEL